MTLNLRSSSSSSTYHPISSNDKCESPLQSAINIATANTPDNCAACPPTKDVMHETHEFLRLSPFGRCLPRPVVAIACWFRFNPTIHFFLFSFAYLFICASILCLALLYTPLGYQGEHYSNLPQEASEYQQREWAAYDRRQLVDNYILQAHPSGSLAVAKLKEWQMIAPPMPILNESIPVSPPNNPEWTMLPQLPIDETYTLADQGSKKPNYPLGDSFALITFASSVYYTRVLNLIGSVHFWEPTQRVIVYDLGFTQEQVIELQCIDNIELRPFNFSIYPKHVRNLFQYYFKPLLVYDALQHASSVLCLDSGIEIRQNLRSIKFLLERDGYFLAGQPNTIGHKSMSESFRQLGVQKDPYDDIQFCAGGMFGFVKDSPAYKLVAVQAAQCALKPSCYSPEGGGRDNHNFDQSINSILLYKYGMHCTHDRKYREMEMARCPIRHDRFLPDEDGVVLCIRRWHAPKPYVDSVHYNERCRQYMCAPELKPDWEGGGPTGRKRKEAESSWIYPVEDQGLIQHTQGSHLAGKSPMAECLLRNHNYRPNCTEEIAAHERGMQGLKKWMIFHSRLDLMRALIFAGLRMPTTYILFALIFFLMLRRVYGMPFIQTHKVRLSVGWSAVWLLLFALVQYIDAKFDK